MHSSRQDLLRLLARKSFRLGEFRLSSGGTSDYYIDCRTTTLDAKGSRLVGEVFFDEIRQREDDAVARPNGIQSSRNGRWGWCGRIVFARSVVKGHGVAVIDELQILFVARHVRIKPIGQLDGYFV